MWSRAMSQAVAPLMYIRALWKPARETDLSACCLWASTMSQLPIQLPGKLVSWSGPPRAVLQEPTSCFLSQYWYRPWESGAEATEDLARRARTNLSLAEVLRMKMGYSPGMGNSRRVCLRAMHGWQTDVWVCPTVGTGSPECLGYAE